MMAERAPLVSIIMAVYNSEAYLKETIQSVIVQDYQNWELIIVNDGSTDNSEKIIEHFLKAQHTIRYIKNEKNSGLVHSLNVGVAAAEGEYIARIDADDVMYPNRISKQVAFLGTHPDVGVVGSDLDIINEKGNIVASWKYPSTDVELKKVLLKKSPFAHPAVMIRKALLHSLGEAYSSKYPRCEDYDLWIRLHKKTKFYSFSEALTKYRVHGQQITFKKVRLVQTDTLKLIVNSVFAGALSAKSLLFLYKPIFYITSPKWLLSLKMNSARGVKQGAEK